MRFFLSLVFLLLIYASAGAEVYVLCYHSFLGRPRVSYDFSLEELKSQLELLRGRGFRFVSLGDLYSGNVTGPKNILVTIDDGNHSVYKAYFDVFKPMGIRPLLAIYPNIIGKKDYALTWEQLKRLSAEGCDIAAHGYYHLKINQKLYDTQRADFNREISTSKKVLEEKLGISVTSFAYPFGLNSQVGEKALRSAGYKVAFTIVNNPVKTPLVKNPDLMRLPRYMLTRQLYQGSLNHIIRLSQRGSGTFTAADSPKTVLREKTPGKAKGRPAKKKSVLAMENIPAHQGRYEDGPGEKVPLTRKSRNANGTRKKGPPRKDAHYIPRTEGGDRELPETAIDIFPQADAVYRLLQGKMPPVVVTAENPKDGAIQLAVDPGEGHGPPCKFKERWLEIGRMAAAEYRRIISLHLDRAASYIQQLITSFRRR